MFGGVKMAQLAAKHNFKTPQQKYHEYSRDATPKCCQLICEFSKIS